MFRSQAVAGILSASKPEAAPDRHLPEAAARNDRNATRVDLPSIDPHGTALLLIGETCLRLDDRARPSRLRPAPSFRRTMHEPGIVHIPEMPPRHTRPGSRLVHSLVEAA